MSESAAEYGSSYFVALLSELESALIGVAITKCNELRDKTQLSAVIFLLIRSASLFRAALQLQELGYLDADDVVRRACLESWMLAYEFRLVESDTKTAKWHTDKANNGDLDIAKIMNFEKLQGIKTPTRGRDYGGLCEVAHPTKSAAENSFVTVTSLHGNSESNKRLAEAQKTFRQEDSPTMLNSLLWLALTETSGMISVGMDSASVPLAIKFLQEVQAEV